MKKLLLSSLGILAPLSVASAGDALIRLTGTVDQDGYSAGPMSSAVVGSVVELRLEVDLPGVVLLAGVETAYRIDALTFEILIDGVPINGAPPANTFFGVLNNDPINDELLTGPIFLTNGDFVNFSLQATPALFSSVDLTDLGGSYLLQPLLIVDAFQFSGAGGLLEISPETLQISVLTLDGDVFCFGDGGDQMGCTDCPCGNNAPIGTLGGCINSAARSAQIVQSGAASVFADTLRFEVRDAASATFAILSSGSAAAPANPLNPCFGMGSGIQSPPFDGLRCVVQNVQRHGTRMTDANGDVGVTTPGWGSPDGPLGGLVANGGFTAGQVRHYQVVYRDDPMAGCATGQNTTPGLSISIIP